MQSHLLFPPLFYSFLFRRLLQSLCGHAAYMGGGAGPHITGEDGGGYVGGSVHGRSGPGEYQWSWLLCNRSSDQLRHFAREMEELGSTVNHVSMFYSIKKIR